MFYKDPDVIELKVKMNKEISGKLNQGCPRTIIVGAEGASLMLLETLGEVGSVDKSNAN